MVPDYYARLGVEPGADRHEIEAALRRVQPIWSLGTRNPKTRHTNQLYLDEIPALGESILHLGAHLTSSFGDQACNQSRRRSCAA